MLRFILNTNLFIAFAALLLTLATGLQVLPYAQLQNYLLFVFFAVLLDYNSHRLLKVKMDKTQNEKRIWSNQHQKTHLIFILLSVIGTLIIFVNFRPEIRWILFALALTTILYSLPFKYLKLHFLNIRRIPGVKSLLIAASWTTATLLVPHLIAHNETPYLWLKLVERFVFIFAITIPFDIKDIDDDKQEGLKTIPVLIGEKKALLLASTLLILFSILGIVQFIFFNNLKYSTAIILSGLISLFILNNKTLKKKVLYYPFWVDGVILVHSLLLFLSIT
ncbi:MAG: UbiA family prenyltransferase [Prolixibacteraceae bacterium]|nr:UbiA family prenyltransferase [Prolixibacteraceae bacterium]